MKIFALLLCFWMIAASSALTAVGQNSAVKLPVLAEGPSDREQDGLNGAVRRVRVETARIVFKNGGVTEEPRVLRGIITYDIKGNRVDSVTQPGEPNNPSGKEQYRRDDKGNIVEMILRGEDGAILSKETYEYEFDALGNWNKKISSVGIYENGKVTFEPIEVTYRTIAYFYSQAVDKVVSAPRTKTGSNRNLANSTRSPAPATPRDVPETSDASGSAQPKPTGLPVSAITSKPNESTDKDSLKSTETRTTEVESKKLPVKHVSEVLLRAAAIALPQPEFPALAQMSGQLRRVQVQVVVNEKGEVTSARGTSPESVMNEPAELAARNARFLPAKLSEEPAQVFSVISYELTPVPSPMTPLDVSEKKEEGTVPNAAAQPGPASDSTDLPANEDRDVLYRQGLAYLNSGQFEDAVDVLRRVVYRNPEYVLGYCKLGLAYSALHKHEEAVAVYKLAIKIRPDLVDVTTYYQLGMAYDFLKKYSDALNAFKQALYVRRAQMIESDGGSDGGGPSLATLQHSLGLEHYKLGRFHDAIKDFKQAVKLDPEMRESYYAMAMAYMSLGDRRSAEKQEAILKTLDPALAKKIASELANRSLFIPPGCLTLPCP